MKKVIEQIDEYVARECLHNPESMAPVHGMGLKAFLMAIDCE